MSQSEEDFGGPNLKKANMTKRDIETSTMILINIALSKVWLHNKHNDIQTWRKQTEPLMNWVAELIFGQRSLLQVKSIALEGLMSSKV